MSDSSRNFQFAKLCCGGNDFIVADCRSRNLPDNLPVFVQALCHRRNGAGADGTIFLLPDDDLPFRILLYNSDGSRAEVSYNGSRCVGLFVHDNKIIESSIFAMNSDAGRIEVAVQNQNVILGVPAPEAPELHRILRIDNEEVETHLVTAGVPYLVLFTDTLDSDWVESIPPRLRTHEQFPAGTNVAVARFDRTNKVGARFFERGVEEETPSSGSGSVALAAVVEAIHEIGSPIIIRCAGGDFPIHFDKDNNSIDNVRTAGAVVFAFEGIVSENFPGLVESA